MQSSSREPIIQM